jgi:hypothetical protein
MSLGVLGKYAQNLFASSTCTDRFFPRILRIRLNIFRVFEDDFVCRKYPQFAIFSPYAQILSAYSPNTLRYFPRILHSRLNTFLSGEISIESVYISVNNNMNNKKKLILSVYPIWDRLSPKTISRYCPFKTVNKYNSV